MFPKLTWSWYVCLWIVLAASARTHAGGNDGLVGSAYLRTLALKDQPLGQRQQDTFPYDGVRIQRWRRADPASEWLVVWIDLKTPGLGYHMTPVHDAVNPYNVPVQAVAAQTTVDFLRTGTDPRVEIGRAHV